MLLDLSTTVHFETQNSTSDGSTTFNLQLRPDHWEMQDSLESVYSGSVINIKNTCLRLFICKLPGAGKECLETI